MKSIPDEFVLPLYTMSVNVDIYPKSNQVLGAELDLPNKIVSAAAKRFVKFIKKMFNQFDADKGGEYQIKHNHFTTNKTQQSEYLLLYKKDPTGAFYARYVFIVRLTTHKLPITPERMTNKKREDTKTHNQQLANAYPAIPNKLPQDFKSIDVIIWAEGVNKGVSFADYVKEYDDYASAEQDLITYLNTLVNQVDPEPDLFVYENYMIRKEFNYFNVYNTKIKRLNKLNTLSTLQEAVDFIKNLPSKNKRVNGVSEMSTSFEIPQDLVNRIVANVITDVNLDLKEFGIQLICLDAYIWDDNVLMMDVIDNENAAYSAGVQITSLHPNSIKYKQSVLSDLIYAAYADLYSEDGDY